MWRPLRLASSFSRTRNREWITWGFLIIRPSFISLRMFWPEEERGHWRIAVCRFGLAKKNWQRDGGNELILQYEILSIL